MKKIIKRMYKIYIKDREESMGISIILLMTVLMLLFMLLSSCETSGYDHLNCEPGCNGIKTDTSDTHFYKPAYQR